MNGTTFSIQDLEPGTSYRICVTAISTSDRRVKSEERCQTIYSKILCLYDTERMVGWERPTLQWCLDVCVCVCVYIIIILVVSWYRQFIHSYTRSPI